MLTIGPLGSAACVRVLAVIRVAGERFTCGRLVRLTKRVAEPNGFLYARHSDCQPAPPAGAGNFPVAPKGTAAMSVCISERKLSPEQQSTRRQAEALAELERNGVDTSGHGLDPRIAARAAIARIEVNTSGGASFKRRRKKRTGCAPEVDTSTSPTAQPMAAADVANVVMISGGDSALLLRLKQSSPYIFASLATAASELWGDGWSDSDERWTLTPHELRKLRHSGPRALERSRKAAAV